MIQDVRILPLQPPASGRLRRPNRRYSIVDGRFWCSSSTAENLEVTAPVRLHDVLVEEGTPAPFESRRRLCPGLTACRQFIRADDQLEPSAGHVEFDDVAVTDQGERPAYEGLRCDVEDRRSVARPAHTRVTYPDHVAHAKLNQFVRHREHSPFGHPGATPRAGILEDEYRLDRDIELGIVQSTIQVFPVFEHYGRSPVLAQVWTRRADLDDGTVRCQIAVQHSQRQLLHWIVELPDHFWLEHVCLGDVLAQCVTVDFPTRRIKMLPNLLQ